MSMRDITALVIAPSFFIIDTCSDDLHAQFIERFFLLFEADQLSATIRSPVSTVEQYGAEVVCHPGNYDESVKQAANDAASNGWTVVSDTSYEGYTEIPKDVSMPMAALWLAVGLGMLLLGAELVVDGAIGIARENLSRKIKAHGIEVERG